MSKFITELDVALLNEHDDIWEIKSDLVYKSDLVNKTITVPTGFMTDFVSVPRVPVMFFLFGSTDFKASALHDYLYVSHEFTREESDDILLEASLSTGEAKWRSYLIWAGVRLLGASHW